MLASKMEKSNLLLGIITMLLGLANSEQADDNSQRNSKVCKYDTSFKRLTNFLDHYFNFQWRPPKHILALLTWGQKCVFSELKLFEITNFDLGHPVCTPSV